MVSFVVFDPEHRIFAYSSMTLSFRGRSRIQVGAGPDTRPGLAVEGSGLVSDLMVPRAVQAGDLPVFVPPDDLPLAFDDLGGFEPCAA